LALSKILSKKQSTHGYDDYPYTWVSQIKRGPRGVSEKEMTHLGQDPKNEHEFRELCVARAVAV